MYVQKDKVLDVLMMKVAVHLQIVYFLKFVEEIIASTSLVKIIWGGNHIASSLAGRQA